MEKDFNNNEEILRRLFYDGYLTQAAYDDLLKEDWLGSQSFTKESKVKLVEGQRGIGPSPKGPVYEKNITTTPLSQNWRIDEYGVIHESEDLSVFDIETPIYNTTYFLVEYIAGEGTSTEKREQQVMTKEEINSLSFWGYRIINISRIY